MRRPFIPATKGFIGIIIKLCAALVLIAVLLAIMPAEVTEKIEQIIPAIRERVFSSVTVVYSACDGADTAAEKIESILSANEDITCVIINENRFSSTSSEAGADLLIFLGHTAFAPETYLSALSRIGEDGYEIKAVSGASEQTDAVYVTAFREQTLLEAAEALAEQILGLSVKADSSKITNITEVRHADDELPTVINTGSGATVVTVLSYPDTDTYSLNAIEKLISSGATGTVVFNDGNALGNDRQTISDAWNAILGKTGSSSVFVNFPALGESGSLAAEVVKALSGEATVYDGFECLMFCDDRDCPTGLVYLVSGYSDGLSGLIGKYSALAERIAGTAVPSVCVYAGLPSAVAEVLPDPDGYDRTEGFTISESFAAYVSSSADAVFSSAFENGVRDFVFGCGYTNEGVSGAICSGAVYSGAQLNIGLVGSVGFDSPGVGGRFELNNSLRGAVQLTIAPDSEDGYSIDMKYIYAADLGLVSKNAGN